VHAAWLLLGRSSHHVGTQDTAAGSRFRTKAATRLLAAMLARRRMQVWTRRASPALQIASSRDGRIASCDPYRLQARALEAAVGRSSSASPADLRFRPAASAGERRRGRVLGLPPRPRARDRVGDAPVAARGPNTLGATGLREGRVRPIRESVSCASEAPRPHSPRIRISLWPRRWHQRR
jgi:hypothetical protein